jgi:rRNA maturation endonuclease Nob1
MVEQDKTKGNSKKRLANWCKKCGKEHENMGVEICDACGGRTDICYGPPDIKGSVQQGGRLIPL